MRPASRTPRSGARSLRSVSRSGLPIGAAIRGSISVVALVVSAALLESCHDGLLHAPAGRAPAHVTMSASVSGSSGGAGEAFDRADQIFVRFRTDDEVRVEQESSFAPSARTVVRLDIPLRRLTETLSAEIELRAAGRPLFRGAAS